MATSNSFNYSVTATDIFTEALEIVGALDAGGTISSNDQTSCLRTLNMMVKQWSGNFDFAPGLKEFSRKRGYVFLQSGQSEYSIGPSGDNATLTYVSTTMRISGVASDSALQVVSTTGMTAGDYIGIELDSGAIQWTTISSVTDSDTVAISSLTSASSVGNSIFTYTTKLIRPLYIEEAVLRDMDGNDNPIYPISLSAYEHLPSKSADGMPGYFRYENNLTDGTVYLDIEPSDVSYVLRITFIAPAEDYDAVTDTIAYPQEWFYPLSIGLAKLIAPKFGKSWTQDLQDNYTSALSMARSSYAETTDMYFQPGLE